MKVTEVIRRALYEDIGAGDITTNAVLGAGSKRSGRAEIRAKDNGVLCGASVVSEVFKTVDSAMSVKTGFEDGQAVEQGDVVFQVGGPVAGLLGGERTALNLLQHLSGIATETNRYVTAVTGTRARISDTRKTLPMLRELQKYAVRTGGGTNHRSGLYDMILIKENHIEAAGGIRKAIERTNAFIKESGAEVAVEVETKNAAEVEEVLESYKAGYYIQRVMLDNMLPSAMTEMVMRIRSVAGDAIEIEASGGVSLPTVQIIAATGVDIVSVGALTHSVKALDFSLIFV